MWFAIIATDRPDSLEDRKAHRDMHRQRLVDLREAGRLLTAGPFPAVESPEPGPAGFTGSLIIAEFDDQAAAQAWADADPYRKHGIYTDVTVKPYLQVF